MSERTTTQVRIANKENRDKPGWEQPTMELKQTVVSGQRKFIIVVPSGVKAGDEMEFYVDDFMDGIRRVQS